MPYTTFSKFLRSSVYTFLYGYIRNLCIFLGHDVEDEKNNVRLHLFVLPITSKWLDARNLIDTNHSLSKGRGSVYIYPFPFRDMYVLCLLKL